MMRIYVGKEGGDVPAGATALDAVRAVDEESAARVENGELVIADSRGLAISQESAAYDGAIYRVVKNREPEPTAQV
jgi:hypothetical protein